MHIGHISYREYMITGNIRPNNFYPELVLFESDKPDYEKV